MHLGVTFPFWNNFHYIAAAVLFAILFYFTLFVFRRAQIEQDVINGQIGPHKRRRNRIYLGRAMCITLAMMAIGGTTISDGIWDHWYHGGKGIASPLCLRRLASWRLALRGWSNGDLSLG